MSESCANCHFAYKGEGKLWCRRYPPQIQLVPASINSFQYQQPALSLNAFFPAVVPEVWCGEYVQTSKTLTVEKPKTEKCKHDRRDFRSKINENTIRFKCDDCGEIFDEVNNEETNDIPKEKS